MFFRRQMGTVKLLFFLNLFIRNLNCTDENDSFEGQNEQNGGEHNDKRIEQLEKVD